MATTAMFRTPEIIRLIAEHTSCDSILNLRLLSRTIQQQVNHDKPLQEHTFLRPAQPDDGHWVDCQVNDKLFKLSEEVFFPQSSSPAPPDIVAYFNMTPGDIGNGAYYINPTWILAICKPAATVAHATVTGQFLVSAAGGYRQDTREMHLTINQTMGICTEHIMSRLTISIQRLATYPNLHNGVPTRLQVAWVSVKMPGKDLTAWEDDSSDQEDDWLNGSTS